LVKVLVLTEWFPIPGNPTAGVFVLEQMRALRQQNVEFEVICPIPWIPGLLRRLPSAQKYVAHPLPSSVDGFAVSFPRVPMFPGGRLMYLSGFVQYLWCRRLVRRMLKKTGINLIHAHAILPPGFAAVLLGRELNIPVSCTAHGSDINVQPWRNLANRWATRWALRRVHRLFSVSRALAAKIYALAGNRQVELVYNGADPQRFRPAQKEQVRTRLGLPASGKLVLFLGNLVPIKNVSLLLESFAQLALPDVRLCLVGDGELRASLEARAKELGIFEHCLFAGRCPHDDVPLWLSAADCLVIPSQMEGFPTILPEAMLCRLPIIATAVGGIPEVILDGDTGVLVPPGDAAALARALGRVLGSPEDADAMAARAQSFAREHLTWDANAQLVVSVYHDMLRSFGPPGTSLLSPVPPQLPLP